MPKLHLDSIHFSSIFCSISLRVAPCFSYQRHISPSFSQHCYYSPWPFIMSYFLHSYCYQITCVLLRSSCYGDTSRAPLPVHHLLTSLAQRSRNLGAQTSVIIMCPLLRTLDRQEQSCSDRLDFRHSSIDNRARNERWTFREQDARPHTPAAMTPVPRNAEWGW